MTQTLTSEVRLSQGQPAGLVSRAAADVLDVAVVASLVVVGFLGVSAFRLVVHPHLFRWPQPGGIDLSFIGASAFVLYLATGWATTGRTIGKQIMGLRVLRRDGSHLGFARAICRAIVCVVFPIGLLWCAIDGRGRAIHDLLVGSSVIYDWGRALPNPGARRG